MNLRTAKLAFALCLLCLINLTASLRAQDTNPGDASQPPDNGGQPQRQGDGRRGGTGDIRRVAAPDPVFDIQIEKGQLSLAAFKDKPAQNPWGTNVSTVKATIENLSKYLRAIDPTLNVVLSPEVGNLTISDLKLNTRNPQNVHEAIAVASGGAIFETGGRGAGFGGGAGFFGGQGGGFDRSLTFVSGRSQSQSSVEVFNLGGYIQTLGKVNDGVVFEKIDELQMLIMRTMDDLHPVNSPADGPHFQFHPGTKLLIVIGKPEALAVTRKIVSALSGQQPNPKADAPLDVPQPSAQP